MRVYFATQSYPSLCGPMDCSLPGLSTHGIFQARILEWGAISYSRISFWICISCQADSLPLGTPEQPLYLNNGALNKAIKKNSRRGWVVPRIYVFKGIFNIRLLISMVPNHIPTWHHLGSQITFEIAKSSALLKVKHCNYNQGSPVQSIFVWYWNFGPMFSRFSLGT